MPSVHPESLLRRVEPVGPNDLRESRVGRRELPIPAAFLAHVEVVRAAEIILCAGAANSRKLGVAVDKKLYLALAPPPVVMHAPGDISANVLSAPGDPVEDCIDFLVWQRIHPPELRTEAPGAISPLHTALTTFVTY